MGAIKQTGQQQELYLQHHWNGNALRKPELLWLILAWINPKVNKAARTIILKLDHEIFGNAMLALREYNIALRDGNIGLR